MRSSCVAWALAACAGCAFDQGEPGGAGDKSDTETGPPGYPVGVDAVAWPSDCVIGSNGNYDNRYDRLAETVSSIVIEWDDLAQGVFWYAGADPERSKSYTPPPTGSALERQVGRASNSLHGRALDAELLSLGDVFLHDGPKLIAAEFQIFEQRPWVRIQFRGVKSSARERALLADAWAPMPETSPWYVFAKGHDELIAETYEFGYGNLPAGVERCYRVWTAPQSAKDTDDGAPSP